MTGLLNFIAMLGEILTRLSHFGVSQGADKKIAAGINM
jgi:hypothetical protein